MSGNPVFSPDGSLVAFTGEYDGNPDVYVVPAAGGVPRRLTYHPGADDTSSAGRPTASKCVSFRPRELSRRSGPALHRPGRRRIPHRVPLARAAEGSSLRMAPASPTCPISNGSRPGSAIAAARRGGHLDCQSRRLQHRSQASRATTRTTSIPCGSATPSTFSPTATAR